MEENCLLTTLKSLHKSLSLKMQKQWQRSLSFGDIFTDRWQRAKDYGFGEGSSCYDNVLILGDVKVGKRTWIGPNVILDGKGGLDIGDYCSISAGVQLYSHDSVKWSLTLGKCSLDLASTKIGSGVYIGPQSTIQKGVTIGNQVIIGAHSFVNRDVPSLSKAYGCPIKVVPLTQEERALLTHASDRSAPVDSNTPPEDLSL